MSVDAKKKLKWGGSWLGSFEGQPSDSAYSGNVQTFSVAGPKLKSGESELAQVTADSLSGRWAGTYLMDNDGSGSLVKYKTTAQMKFRKREDAEPEALMVCGKGSNEFGAFVIAGTYNISTGMLDAPRTYIADDDERVKLSLDDLLDASEATDSGGSSSNSSGTAATDQDDPAQKRQKVE